MAQERRKSAKRKVQPRQKSVSPAEIRRMVEEANQDRPPFPAEGMARCVSNEGMAGDLKVGEIVYLREIPNMGGHCVILRNEKMPLVGHHLDRFELLDDDDV